MGRLAVIPEPSTVAPHADLARLAADLYADPLGFVRTAYPWPINGETGPDVWQAEFLAWLGDEITTRGFNGSRAVAPIRGGVSSGHGIGKGALTGWLTDFIMVTRPHCVGSITANTNEQLEKKTWAAIRFWTKLCIFAPWFTINSEIMYKTEARESWFCAPQSCAEQNSEAFAGQHAKSSSSFYINDEDCHSADTEILTRRGWVLFSALRPDDECVTMSQGTGIAEYLRPTSVHWAHRRGEMIEYRARNASWCVTPHHRMWSQRRQKGRGRHETGWRWVEAAHVNNSDAFARHVEWGAADVDVFTIPPFVSDRKSYPARTVPMDEWVTFLGWYFSEGNLVHRQNRYGGREHTAVGISNRDITPAREVSVRLGLNGHVYNVGHDGVSTIRFHDRALAEHLSQFGPTCLQRRLPDFLRDLSARQINRFLDAYVCGDGYRKTTKLEILYTSSPFLADGLQELCLKGGWGSTITTRRLRGKPARILGHDAVSSTDGYVVTRSAEESRLLIRPSHLRRIHYDGLVYCATLPRHHLLYTRRDGTCFWSGNSAVPDVIHEVEEGGLTDGEPMIFLFGNPTRNTGKFYEAAFGRGRDRWHIRVIDSRDCALPNKAQIEEWAQDYGEDSDFFRVRVRGLPPTSNELQFIETELIDKAKHADVMVLADEPLIAGVDMSGGGSAWTVCWFRRGLDARTVPPIRIPGSKSKAQDRPRIVSALAERLSAREPDRKIAAMFIDSAFGAVIVQRLNDLGFANVHEVNFGAESPDEHQKNQRAYQWNRMKEWLSRGAIPRDDVRLSTDLAAPGFHLDAKHALVLESKESMQKRGVASPDNGDALCFEGSTLIRTPSGQRPIASLCCGDAVCTPFGVARVAALTEMTTMALTTVEFSNGQRLRGTPHHEVFTFSRGVQRLDALSLTDEMDTWSGRALWRLVKAWSIGASDFGFKHLARTFSPGERVRRSDFCIAAYGLTRTALFHRLQRCITSMTTGATTIQTTWPFGQQEVTSASTWPSDWRQPTERRDSTNTSPWPARRPLNGIDRRKVELGTVSTGRRSGSIGDQPSRSAWSAGSHSTPSSCAPSIAHPRAASVWRSGRISRTLACAWAAVRRSWRTVIGRPRVAPVRVQTDTGWPSSVHNLVLDRDNAYYANGILVFNSLTFAQPVAIKQTKKPYAGQHRQQRSWMGLWFLVFTVWRVFA